MEQVSLHIFNELFMQFSHGWAGGLVVKALREVPVRVPLVTFQFARMSLYLTKNLLCNSSNILQSRCGIPAGTSCVHLSAMEEV